MPTILVVDDQRTNRDLVRATLTHRGYDIVEAADGQEALAKALHLRPDLVLTDILMPGLDGCELVRELRANHTTADVPVIFYTANYLQHEVGAIAKAYSVARVLIKGGDPQALLDAVDTVLPGHPVSERELPEEGLIREHLRTVNAKLVDKIREMESTEQELRRSEERFRQMAQSAPVGIVLGHPDGSARYINTRLTEITGRAPDALVGTTWQTYLGIDGWRPDLDAAAAGGEPARCRRQIEHADGTTRWLDISLTALRDRDGNAWGTVGIVDDVTTAVEADARKRELDTRARVAERLESLGQLAGGVAHDFNNILTGVLAYTQFAQAIGIRAMESGELDNETGQQLLNNLDRVLKAGNRAAHLTAQLLAFGRPDIVQPETLDINVAVREVQALLARTIGSHIELVVECATDLAAVVADPSQLSQVILNLAVNSRDAMPKGGQITIRTGNHFAEEPEAILDGQLPAGRYVRLTVADNGQGMPPEVLTHVFEPFFTTKPVGQGTGLGLSTVHGVVRQTGGHMTINSIVGTGTTIDIFLPAVEAAPTTERQPLEAGRPAPTGTETVLIVDDEETICDIASTTLTRAGYRALVAVGGAEALELIADLDEPVDLLLTDVVMPRMFGTALAQRLTSQRPKLQVLFMSGYAEALLNDEHVIPSSALVLSKPFSPPALLHAVRAVLDGRRPSLTIDDRLTAQHR